jgi:hypothetical protein
MTQEYYHKQQLHKQRLQEPIIMTPTMFPSSYLNKAVISLDYIQIGNVVDEENDKLLIIDSNYRNKFSIPSCKVISVDKTDANSLIVDLEYQEAGRYRIVE